MSITYLEAIREAQAKLLRDDERVFIYGQDVGGTFGGAFKATKGLAKEFPGRVLNTPISEDAMVGAAIGAAIEGMRPIVEMQFADFSSIALNQILNNSGTHYWRTNVPIPITVRLPSGGTKGSGPFHSQSMESIYAHYPGLIVMTPATVEDAYTMLIEAVAIDDPVIYCEHKYLYYHLKADRLPEKGLPTGRARIAREGRDLTIVSYSAMMQESLGAAEELAREGFEIEVVDLRTVKPLDTDTVLASVDRFRGAARPRKSSRASLTRVFICSMQRHNVLMPKTLPFHIIRICGARIDLVRKRSQLKLAHCCESKTYAASSNHHAAARRINRRSHHCRYQGQNR